MTKILIDKETVELALEALESCDEGDWSTGHVIHPSYNEKSVEHAITALRQAIEQSTEQKPVAWESILGAVARGWCYEENANKTMDSELAVAIAKEVQALYTQPQEAAPRQWVGLTDGEIESIAKNYALSNPTTPLYFARAIEAAHGITGEKE